MEWFDEMQFHESNFIAWMNGTHTQGETFSSYGSTAAPDATNLDSATNLNGIQIQSRSPAAGGFNDAWGITGNKPRLAANCKRFLANIYIPIQTGFWLLGLTAYAANSGGTTFYGGELGPNLLVRGAAFCLGSSLAPSVNWQLVTNNGAGTMNFVDTGIAFTGRQTLFELRFDFTKGIVWAVIDNVVRCSSTVQLPAASDTLFMNVGGYKPGVAVSTPNLYLGDIKLWERLPI
jgi:hypothetical protein